MQDALTRLSSLNRPALLVRTARHGLSDYSRVRHLPRLLKTADPVGPSAAILRLLDLEGAANEKRLASAAEYSIAEHIELLIALMHEAELLRASQRQRAAQIR